MRLVIRGLERPPAEQEVAPTEIASRCQGEQNGCFKYDYSWDLQNGTLTLTFTTRILIAQGLDPALRQAVRTHEGRHYQDFRQIVGRLEQTLRRVLLAGREPDMDSYLAWFEYDICVAGADFHRSVNRIPRICMPPNGPRPR